MLTAVRIEEVALSLMEQLQAQLPDAIAEVNAAGASRDARWANLASLDFPLTAAVALTEPVMWLPGHIPSILDRPIEQFPNIVVMCYDHRAQPDPASDHTEPSVYTAYAEVFCAMADETVSNRTAWRYAEALHAAMVSDETLGGLVVPISQTPAVMVSNAAGRRASPQTDDVVWIQGARVEYEFVIENPWIDQ